MSLTVRWTYGDTPNAKLKDDVPIEMLHASVTHARTLWPKARFVIQTNHIEDVGHHHSISALAYMADAELLDNRDLLPEPFQTGARSGWWKFAPLRLNTGGHELWLDNDFIVWRESTSLQTWLEKGGVIMQGNLHNGHLNPGEFGNQKSEWGSYSRHYRETDPLANLTSGLTGFGPDIVDFAASPEEAKTRFFVDEQAWVALTWQAHNRLIATFTDYPIINHNPGPKAPNPGTLMEWHCGAHFTEHNVGRKRSWLYYRDRLMA